MSCPECKKKDREIKRWRRLARLRKTLMHKEQKKIILKQITGKWPWETSSK